METFRLISPIRGRAAWIAAVWVAGALASGGAPDGSHPAARGQSHPGADIEEARELLRKGDEAYQAGRYSEAVEAYAGAREMIPEAADSAEFRAAVTGRYAQAAVEQARLLSRKGDIAAAKATVDKVLGAGVAPNDPGARAFRAQLDDPIRTNPALTAEHARDVDEVRRLLYTAEGAYNLGKFDEAKKHYEEVLRIDPTNTAARRGMETVAAAKSGYQKAAYDHTRAEILSQVDAAWETQITPPDLGVGPDDPGGLAEGDGTISIATKLERIIIPKLALDQASLDEALDFIRIKAAENDTLEPDPARKGVNITVNLGPPDSEAARSVRERKFDLQLSQVPLSQALKYLTEITQTSFTTDDFSVVIRPAGSTSDELITRTYRVPPDFITNLSAGAQTGAADEDPFAKAPAGGALPTTRLSARDALSKQGISFPEGAVANYNPATNTLRVVNTAANQDFISQVVETMNQTEPVMVSVRVTMIRTQQTNLQELGFDWLINPFALNSSESVFAGGGTVGNTPGRTGADFISNVGGVTVDGVPANSTDLVNQGLVTNGLRSGDQAINSNNIDELISNPNRAAQGGTVAPGVMSLTGLFTDGQVQMIMRGLDQKKGVDIMAQPSTVTRSGQASSVAIVREFIYPSEYEPPELPNSVGETGGATSPVTPATPTAFEKKDVGITLEVLPVADAAKRYVDVTINPSFIDFDGFVNYGSPINSTVSGLLGTEAVEITPNTILMPVFSSQKAATQLTVADGATIAIGGLMGESIQIVDDKVPVLGDIPWVGRLFASKAKQPVSTAVVFLVHVELLDPTGRPYRDR
jgi:general secretion pathway protein D